MAPRPPRPATPVPPITYPESLPVSGRRDEIARAIRGNPVVIVCGETGSGKTTQLPKIALELGRGLGAGGRGLIGHTQPRRIAASSVAKRIAEELNSPLGEVVGYKVRFNDRLQPGASVKLMTDGILLAETQRDPDLRNYDTLIIDEAHERSLNIDFLLGYLRQLLPRRPDLKVIVTSATIDADRFANHFASARGPAPVIQVSGRLFPVEQRWHPFEESRESDLNTAIAEAVDELWRGTGAGDILVFLPGEREIRETADHLRKPPRAVSIERRTAGGNPAALRAPVAGRAGPRVPKPATAGASCSPPTWPRPRSPCRASVMSSIQRPGACQALQLPQQGRAVAGGAHQPGRRQPARGPLRARGQWHLHPPVRRQGLRRPAASFTDPEILRSFAGRRDPAHEEPALRATSRTSRSSSRRAKKAIADGYALLAELGAVDDDNELTRTGTELAKLPLDPRVGRMILEARERQALERGAGDRIAALSVQDVRDRPIEQRSRRPTNGTSPLTTSEVEVRRLRSSSGSGSRPVAACHGHAQQRTAQVDQHKLSQPASRSSCLREHFISPRRVREWRDIHAQLHTVVAEQGWRLNGSRPRPTSSCTWRMLAGLLGNIGLQEPRTTSGTSARAASSSGATPAATCRARSPAAGSIAAELVETTRLFGRGIANDRAAVDSAAWPATCSKRQLLEPHWEKKSAEVIALERATLYGIVIYNNRRVSYGHAGSAPAARDIFIRERAGRPPHRATAGTRKLPVPRAQPQDGRVRCRSWSTRRGARTCWWTRT